MRQKTHKLLVTVHCDKPCTKAHAVREARNLLCGPYFTGAAEHGDPEAMEVRSVKPVPAGPSKCR